MQKLSRHSSKLSAQPSNSSNYKLIQNHSPLAGGWFFDSLQQNPRRTTVRRGFSVFVLVSGSSAKIELAKELLRGTSKSISQISVEAGFQNTGNFIAVFKRIEGVTPSLYRQYLFSCFEPGQMKNTYGTGCFLLMNTGAEPIESKNGLITTIAASCGDKVSYALEGSIFIAGAAIQWLRDELNVIAAASESESFARSVPDTAGAYVVPAFTGLGAPYWNQRARGVVTGITRGFSRAHLVRATLESLAYQTYDIAKAMENDAGRRISELNVDGGACANDFLMQFQSDLIGCSVCRPDCIETTALGAAYLAGLAVGYWESPEDIRSNWSVNRKFVPTMPAETRLKLLKGWQRAVRCALLCGGDEE